MNLRRTHEIQWISVSREGKVLAKRKGRPPVQVSDDDGRIRVVTPLDRQPSGVPPEILVYFTFGKNKTHKGSKEFFIEQIGVDDIALSIEVFCQRYAVSLQEIGAWVRSVIEQRLDQAELSGNEST